MPASITMNGLAVVALRLVTPFVGAWFAEVDIDFGALPPVLPPGPAIITIGNPPSVTTLRGFIDRAASGTFGNKARARVVAGLGGWSKAVIPQHFHNDAGVLSTIVIAATAALVGEVAVVPTPKLLGVDYVRAAGPASRVLDGEDWHVDLTGTTQVLPRVPIPANPLTVEVLEFDPCAQRAVVATDDVLSPGTILLDTRFGSATVRDVEQTWDATGSRAIAWCGPSTVSRLAGALRKFAREAAGVAHLKIRRYRVVLEGPDGRVALQPVEVPEPLGAGEMPPTLPISIWPGMSGLSAQLTPASEVLVAFIDGDPAQPVVLGFSSAGKPITLTLDALTTVIVGAGAPPLSQPVAKYPELAIWAAAVVAACAASTPPITIPPLPASVASTKLVVD